MTESSWVQVPSGVAGEFSSSGSAFCADSYFSIHSTPMMIIIIIIIIIIMDISMAHDPKQGLGHNAPYKKLQKNVQTHTVDKIKRFQAI